MRTAHFSPGHLQTADMKTRWGKAQQWLGADQSDPLADDPEIKMCRCADALAEVIKAWGKQDNLCGSKDRGYCPHHEKGGGDLCGYRRQRIEAASGAIERWAFSHANLAHPMPEPFQNLGFDAVVIDESFYGALLGGFGPAPFKLAASLLVKTDWRAPEWQKKTAFVGDFLTYITDRVFRALDPSSEGRIKKSSFRNRSNPLGNLRKCECQEAADYLFLAKIDPANLIVPGMTQHAAAEVLKAAQERNSLVRKMLKLVELLALTIEGEGDLSP